MDMASMSSAAYWPSAPAPPLPVSCVKMGTRLGSYCGLNLTWRGRVDRWTVVS
jgi:hypothetical protein